MQTYVRFLGKLKKYFIDYITKMVKRLIVDSFIVIDESKIKLIIRSKIRIMYIS